MLLPEREWGYVRVAAVVGRVNVEMDSFLRCFGRSSS
jgi:hypothetical protein